MPKDNSTIKEKISLRRKFLREISAPVVLETHGGSGRLFNRCYANVEAGAVFEKDERKADFLARQRPTWAVYQSDCVGAITAGACHWLPVNFLDCDPFGEPWPVLTGFFQSERPFAEKMVLVVNDGLRQKVQMGGAWNTKSLSEAVQHFGNDLYDRYLEVCRWLLEKITAHAGYQVSRFEGYHCGFNRGMTHYGAILSRA